jgi:hypothetical protein
LSFIVNDEAGAMTDAEAAAKATIAAKDFARRVTVTSAIAEGFAGGVSQADDSDASDRKFALEG